MMEIEVVANMGPDGRAVQVANMSDLPTAQIGQSREFRELAGQLTRWIDNAKAAAGRTTMFDRGMFTPPENPYDEMRAARAAVQYDEVVSGVCEVTEAFAFAGVKWESPDRDDADIFNQLAIDQNLDGVVRAMWKEEFCVDDQTQALTRRGWMLWHEIRPDDELFTLDPQTGAASWQPLQDLTTFDWDGPIYRIENNRFSAVATPNHRWVVRDRAGRHGFKKTTELIADPSGALVIGGGDVVQAFAKEPEFSDELVELVGWIVTEGHYQAHESKALNGILVAQSRIHNPEYVDRLRRLADYFRATSATVTEYRHGPEVSHWYFGRGIAEIVRAIAPDRQLLPEFLCALTFEQAQLLYDTLIAGDGHVQRSGGTTRWSQKDLGRIAGFQMLSAMLGIRSRAVPQRDSDVAKVTAYRQDVAHVKNLTFTEQHYKGIVWCPTTPNHTWLARRDGGTFWTANTYGQFVAAKLWGWREYTVRGKTSKGNARKKTVKIWAPLQIRILDSTKVVPVGLGPLGGERLAWQATLGEIGYYQSTYSGEILDPLMLAFFEGTYHPSSEESAQLSLLRVDTTRLLSLNPDYVFRHTLTKPDYERFADIRLKSCFRLLDLKRQLLTTDRALLIGAANYILLIRKGLPNEPAQPEEIANLRDNYNFLAKVPVIISDHRLDIQIVAPKTDLALQSDKYDTLDHRLLMRLLGTLSIQGKGQRNETQMTLANSVARVMENRRHMLKRTLELEVARAVINHPKNRGVFNSEPNLVYTPRRVELSLDQAYLQALLTLRTQREISRETVLEFFGLDEATEAQRLEMEDELFDDVFRTQIPFAAPGAGGAAAGPNFRPATDEPETKPATPNGTPEAPKVSGGRGGRPAGGGKTAQSPQAQTKPRTPNGNVSTK